MNRYFVLRLSITLLLASSFLLEVFNLISYKIGITIIDEVYIFFVLTNIAIIWIKKPFFWYLGLLVFSTAIYHSVQFNFFYSSNNIPAIMSAKPIFYHFQKAFINSWFYDFLFYLSDFLYFIFLILFLFNCQVKRYYKISCWLKK